MNKIYVLPPFVLTITEMDFKSLKTVSIQCPQTLSIQQDSFSGCTAIETLKFDVHSFTIPLGAFAGSTSLTVNYKGTGFNSE
ncbi:hypothetical protein M9Y10_027125 [Tritrichomonas musculus]|uniref:Uncharacterized protein n=1 Tax=Tritrichomonas musculus TaxID=1915356 RepID=A0ABR2H6P0_9EUKA